MIAVNGPWSAHGLGNGSIDELAVAAFPSAADGQAAAPRGGQLFVVPRCAKNADAGWKLAMELTAPALQQAWALRFGIVPTTTDALAKAGRFSNEFYTALKQARPLPRHPATPSVFDDLTPAIAAVVAKDATASEALAGTARAWTRLLARHGVAAKPDAGAP